MSQSIKSKAPRLALALVSAFTVAAVAAPVAGATVTSTNITSSTIKAWDLTDETDSRDLPVNDRTVSGTVDAGASVGDNVNVKCFDPISGSSILSGGFIRTFGTAKVTAAKKWSVTAILGNISGNYCRIVAVPDGVDSVTPADLTAKYKGSRIASIGYWSRSFAGLGGAAGNQFIDDYEFDMQSKSNGYWYQYSLGSCGICTSKPRNQQTGAQGNALWNYNSSTYDKYLAFLTAPTSGSNADPVLLVDRRLGLDPYMLPRSAKRSAYRFGSRGGISVSYSINQRNGDVTIKESSPLYYCVDETEPTRVNSCTTVNQTGVRINRVVTVTADHMIWRTADTYSSADGKAHSVRVTYANNQRGTNGYRFGATGEYKGSVKGDKSGAGLGAAPRNAYAVIGVKYDRTVAAPSADNPVGDVVMSPRPALVRFFGDNENYFYPRWNLTVPKKGNSVTVKQAYTIATSDANLTRLRNTAISGLAK